MKGVYITDTKDMFVLCLKNENNKRFHIDVFYFMRGDIYIFGPIMETFGEETNIPPPNSLSKYVNGDLAYFISFSNITPVRIESYENGKYKAKCLTSNLRLCIYPENLLPYKWWELLKNCKLAFMEVSKCLLKLNICKDMRVYIANWIWETRNDYLWIKNNN